VISTGSDVVARVNLCVRRCAVPTFGRSVVDGRAREVLSCVRDPTRLQILDLLAEGERSVGELVELIGQSQPKVSNHLACLRWCGFVVARREHPRVRYSIADPRVIEVIAIARVLLERNADHVACCRVLESEKGSGGGRR